MAAKKPSNVAVSSQTANLQPTPFALGIRDLLLLARQQAYVVTNQIMVRTYWEIGRRIIEEEQNGQARAGYGTRLLEHLSHHLSADFGEGFSLANLKNFRQFYLTFPEGEKSYAVRSELSWTHLRLIMRVENPDARTYYIQEAAAQGWSSRVLERNIRAHTYERLLTPPRAKEVGIRQGNQPASSLIKDPYVLEFLGLSEPVLRNESALEAAIIHRLERFLMELGRGFSFVARQFRISTETTHYYVDLVFYNYLLKCFVLIDLKTRKLTHQDIGQIDMYVRMFDVLKRTPDDNPTLGLILCTDKDETMVRYSVLSESQQLFASRYRLVLPTEEELLAELERRHVLGPLRQQEAFEDET